MFIIKRSDRMDIPEKSAVVDVKIKYSAGSKFQAKAMTESLATILHAWQMFYMQSHKKNKFDIIWTNTKK